MRRGLWLGLLGGVLAGACVDLLPYQCEDDEDCRSGELQGWCEDARFCSYPDDECPSGRRYSDLAGPLARECTGVPGGSSSSGTTGVTPPASTDEGSSSSSSEDTGVVDPFCGDGNQDPGEDCDDGNDQDGDGCSAECIKSGSVIWSSTVASEDSGNDRLFGLTRLTSGRVMAVGYFQAASRDILLSRWNVDGTEEMRVVHDVAGGTDEAEAVVQSSTGPIFVCGRTTIMGSTRPWVGSWDAALALDPTLDEALPAGVPGTCFDIAFFSGGNITAVGGNGTTAWAYRFTDDAVVGGDTAEVMGISETRFKSIVRAPNGDAYVAGQVADIATVYQPASPTDLGMSVVETNNVIQPQSMAVTSDTIVLGGLLRDAGGFDELWAGAYDLSGAEQWTYVPPQLGLGADEIEDITLDPAGNAYAVGHVTRDNDNPDRWVGKIAPGGELVWECDEFEDAQYGADRMRSIEVLPEGDLIVVAEVTNADGDLDGWIARLVP